MKELYWIGSSLDDIKRFPQAVRQAAGYALYLAQEGGKHPDAKPLKGFLGAAALEVVSAYITPERVPRRNMGTHIIELNPRLRMLGGTPSAED